MKNTNYFTVKYTIENLTRSTMFIASSKSDAIKQLHEEYNGVTSVLTVKCNGPLIEVLR